MKIAIVSLISALFPGMAWAATGTGAPEIPAGTAAIIVAGLTAGVLFIRSCRTKSKQKG